MYAAISGLKSHMTKLNVIGNNIANVNTYGYKSARTTFRETIYTTMTAGSEGTPVQGGINPNQIGYGCNIGTIDLDMSNGPAVPTGINLDCMIQGDGFFLVGDKGGVQTDSLNSLMMSKVGDFDFDSDGYLVDGAGNIVYGFLTVNGTIANKGQANETFTPSATPGSGTTADGTGGTGISTQLVPIRLPLAAAADDTNNPPLYEAGDPIYPGVNADGTNTGTDESGGIAVNGRVSVNIDSLKIESSGKIVATTENNEVITIGYVALGKVENPAGLNHLNGPYYQAGGSAGDLAITSAAGGVSGYLNNPKDPANPGANAVRIIGSDNSLLSGFLEGSGTDLATEFSEMITTQRGYQANTRIVTVTDTMLEELVNMKR